MDFKKQSLWATFVNAYSADMSSQPRIHLEVLAEVVVPLPDIDPSLCKSDSGTSRKKSTEDGMCGPED
jgi:hypothetical protein